MKSVGVRHFPSGHRTIVSVHEGTRNTLWHLFAFETEQRLTV